VISVLILTLNEEVDLPACLKSVNWCDDIVVYDSFSTDGTIRLAESAGARVFQRRFDNYAAQRSAALTEVSYKYPWVLMVDADERWDQSLFTEIKAAIQDSDQEICLYHFRRKDFFQGKWLRRSTGYPTWTGRLVRLGRVSVEREINEEYRTNGKSGYIKGHFIHYPFNKGIAFWYERHNLYSSMEAARLVEKTGESFQLSGIFSKNSVIRRKSLKQLAYRLPGRPLIVFLYLYLFRLGFLDGGPGLSYCVLRSIYEYMIDLKVKEMRRRDSASPI
jgi:glycosyltransferase involved in cell wall biosynthesis